MKKMLMIALMSLAMTSQVSAQDVLNDIVNRAHALFNDSSKNKQDRQVALFKYDALTYLRAKVIQPTDVMGNSVDYDKLNAKIKTLNEQAFAMNTYINVYFERLAQCKKKNVDMVKFYFRQATKDHPLFQEETDLEYVDAYFNQEKEFPLPFSMNCDWVKTLEFIRTIDWSDK